MPSPDLTHFNELEASIIKHMPDEPAYNKIYALAKVQTMTLAHIRLTKNFELAEEKCVSYLAQYQASPTDPRPEISDWKKKTLQSLEMALVIIYSESK